MRLVICVSLRIAASAEAPSSPMRLFPILQGTGGGTERGHMCVSARALTEANARAAAHSRWEIIVSLRTGVSAEAPSAPMWLYRILYKGWVRGHSERAGACQRALTQKRTLLGGGAL